MLNIITNYNVLPKKKFVDDVEVFFWAKWKEIIKHPEFSRIIKEIDNADVLSVGVIKTKHGTTIPLELSSGCKALLIAITYDNLYVSFLEAGGNVLKLAFELANKYNINIVTTKAIRVLDKSDLKKPLILNGKKATLDDYLREVVFA